MDRKTQLGIDEIPNNKEQIPLEHYKEEFRKLDPLDTPKRVGIEYLKEKSCFYLNFMHREYEVSWPDFEVNCVKDNGLKPLLESSAAAQILLLRYLLEGRYREALGQLLAYRDIPWGDVYVKQFTGRCIMRLAFSYGSKLSVFSDLMERMGATRFNKGDVSYDLEFMPGLHVYLILWAGDDEFPPNSQILFSDNFPDAFTAEDLAVVGDVIIGAMKSEGVK